jgi:cystathionine beta-lyase
MTLTQEADGRYVVDLDAFASTIQPHTRLFVLCNPHNPVGRMFERRELEQMAEHCLRHDLVICSDEIHCDIHFDGHPHIPIATLDPDIAARTITLMSPSKTYNLAGLHCAFAIIPNAALREQFVAQRRDLVHRNVNILGATAAIAAYRHGQAWLDALLHYLDGNRQTVQQYVKTKLPGVSMAMPEGTYLAWLDCRQTRIPNHDPFTFFLEQARVGLNDGRDFGQGGVGFVRLNFGCPRSLLMQALDRMCQALEA